ncbi:response regulator, partial [bacterium]
MIDRRSFDSLIRDTIGNLYDFAALDAHPLLYDVIKPAGEVNGNQADYIRQVFTGAIETLRPLKKDNIQNAPEWRPYIILQKRYIEGMGLKELATWLSISDRQLRRDHHRALAALSTLLWNQLNSENPSAENAGEDDGQNQFELHKERINLQETCQGVVSTMKRRLDEQGIHLSLDFGQTLGIALTDRVILRQLLISLFNDALQLQNGGLIAIRTLAGGRTIRIEIDFQPDDAWESTQDGEEDGTLETVRYWSERIDAHFAVTLLPGAGGHQVRFSLELPRADQRVVLVVDDQLPTINLFKRYLSTDDLQVVGVVRSEQVLPLARELSPALITLDVMMPQTDGWEILQLLKLDEATRKIPVLICSTWEEPELARSLGAAAFLKKPITQKQLRDTLQ